MLHFLEGIRHAERDDFRAVGAATGEARVKFFFAGRHHEQVGEGPLDGGIGAGADLGGTLDVDVHDHVDSGFEVGDDLGFQRAVEISVNGGVFEEEAGFETGFEIGDTQKMVVLTVDFTGPRWASGAGNRVMRFSRVREFTAESGFPGS